MNPTELFLSLWKNAEKMLSPNPRGGLVSYRGKIQETENYLISYTWSKSSHWNLGGNHYKYFHDKKTGEFIPDNLLPASAYKEKILNESKFLKADREKYLTINAEKI